MTKRTGKPKARPSKREQTARRRQRRERAKLLKALAELPALRLAASELDAINKADIKDLFDADGQLKRLQDLPEDLRLAIADCEVDPTTGRLRSVTFKDKIDALEKLLGLLGEADKPEVVALLRAARHNQQRVAEIVQAMLKMREGTDQRGSLN